MQRNANAIVLPPATKKQVLEKRRKKGETLKTAKNQWGTSLSRANYGKDVNQFPRAASSYAWQLKSLMPSCKKNLENEA